MKWIILILIAIAGILCLIFWDKIVGAGALITSLIFGGTEAIKKTQEEKIKRSVEKIQDENQKLVDLTFQEKKKLEELENAKKNTDAMLIDDLVDYGNSTRSRRNIRSDK